MSNEEKDLLLKDLSSRAPYGVKCDRYGNAYELVEIDIKRGLVYLWRYDWFEPTSLSYSIPSGDEIKPYLRPLSSMTEEEKEEMTKMSTLVNSITLVKVLGDWLNKNHFDYRGLIEKGLALEAPEGMYD